MTQTSAFFMHSANEQPDISLEYSRQSCVLTLTILKDCGLSVPCDVTERTALHLRVLIHPEILSMFCSSKSVRVPSSGIHKVCVLAQVIT